MFTVNAFWGTRGATRVQDVQRMIGLYRHCLVMRTSTRLHLLVIIEVAVPMHPPLELSLVYYYRHAGGVAQLHSVVYDPFVVHHLVGLFAAACADQHFGVAVLYADGQLRGCKPTEHHRVDGTDACAGQLGDDALDYHRHVYNYGVALVHMEIFNQA